MADITPDVATRVSRVVALLSRRAPVRAAYVFGSQTDGTAHAHSDIDLAVFVEGLRAWDLRRRALAIVQVQKESGDDIEVH
ncbi:nucleotidyltransferase domain-containing protein, partial [Candidatus Fermentibacteria bacterium]|nr:nucleotidyltransferase domain-containing protein [Candidatus Fermentibacteria bacterium]